MDTQLETYRDRLAARRAVADLKRHAGFGMAISSILIGWSAWKYYFVVGVNDTLWLALLILGLAGLVAARAMPSIWTLPERTLAAAMQHVGHWLFAIVLAFLYFALVTPLGIFARMSTGESFVQWHREPSPGRARWTPKEITADGGVRRKRRSLLRSLTAVVVHFHQRRLYFVLPFLAIVLALGLALFFVKGSALAPFIYTLF
jgi:Family of unknown function (DUF5989)